MSHDVGGRANLHDQTSALLTHHGQYRAHDVDRAEQRGLDLCAEVLGGDFLKEPSVEVARVIDQCIDPSEPVDGCLDRGIGANRVGDVEPDGQYVVAGLIAGVTARGCASSDNGVAQRCQLNAIGPATRRAQTMPIGFSRLRSHQPGLACAIRHPPRVYLPLQ